MTTTPHIAPRGPADRSSRPRTNQQRSWLLVAIGLTCLAVSLAVVAWGVLAHFLRGTAALPAPRREPTDQGLAMPNGAQTVPVTAATANDATAIDDDGRTLWVSPTHGQPLGLAYLPSGVQIIAALRPRSLDEHPEGQKILAALGPFGQRGLQYLVDAIAPMEDIEDLIIGCQTANDGTWHATLVARLHGTSTAAQLLAAKFPDGTEQTYHEATYLVAHEHAYWLPNERDDRLLVVARADAIAEIIDLSGEPPPLRRDMERLLAHSDADRQLTLLCAPHFLFSGGSSVFSGEVTRLREPLFWLLGDELSAAALSLHWDEDFFVELAATPTLDTSPERAARILADRVAQIPDRLEEHAVGLDAAPYGRRVVAQFPAMVRKLATYTRSGFESDHALLRCYLPAVAGHNLLLGAELTLAESLAPARGNAAPLATPSATSPAVIESADVPPLQQVTSLAFPRDTLEAALDQLSQNIGVEIVIRGLDLQAEGITRNQSFGIDIANKPAEEILVTILRLANPDKSATGPSDERQKLVYVVSPPGAEVAGQIVVTTRAAAAERGEELPAVFRSPSR